MPTLMGLPNEILTAIIEAIEPDDIESFSTCCKLIHSLARHRIEKHKEKKSLFSTLDVEDDISPFPRQPWDKKYGEPGTYLKEFLSDERNRLYPKAMIVKFIDDDGLGPMNSSRTARTSTNDGLNVARHQLKCTMAGVHSMIGLDFGENEAEEWAKKVQAGYPIATFLLLLALLPNLEKITISVDYLWSSTLVASYTKILRHMTETALGQKGNGLGLGRRLSECTIYGESSQGIGEGLLPYLMMFPRMQKMGGDNLDIEDRLWPYKDAVSPVVDLDLEGAIDTHSLSSYIRGIRELKRFRYSHVMDAHMPWPCDIVAALRQSAFKTLVHLCLTTDVSYEMIWHDSSPGIGSLRAFEVLETIRLHYLLIFEGVQLTTSPEPFNSEYTLEKSLEKSLVKAQNLIDFFPSLVRSFHLEHIVKGRLILDAFKGFKEHRVERLPKLHSITLEVGDEINSQIDTICKESGVQVKWEHKEMEIMSDYEWQRMEESASQRQSATRA